MKRLFWTSGEPVDQVIIFILKCKKAVAPSITKSATAFFNVVGEEGFEPPTLWSQTRCATKLRYSPTNFVSTLGNNESTLEAEATDIL